MYNKDGESSATSDSEINAEDTVVKFVEVAPASNNVNSARKSHKICLHFAEHNNCIHGIAGKFCPFTHPKTCNKWKRFGRCSRRK